MSTDVLPWHAQANIDSPWRRLHWTLPLALLICAIAFIWFAYSMKHPGNHAPEPVPINAELIELPPPAQPQPPSHQKIIVQTNSKPAIQPTPPVQLAPAPPVQHEQPSDKPAPVAPPPPAPAANNSPAQSESQGAQAIIQPRPVIPDELRQEAMNEEGIARFHIAVDGSATVELIKPTQNPRLNRLWLDTLKNWKFFPAMKEGKPVASVADIVIRVQVK
jgi:protein TonB